MNSVVQCPSHASGPIDQPRTFDGHFHAHLSCAAGCGNRRYRTVGGSRAAMMSLALPLHASHTWCGFYFCCWPATRRCRCLPHPRALPGSSSCQHSTRSTLRRLRPRFAPTSSWLPCRFKLYRFVYVRSLTYVLQVEAVVAGDHDKLAGCWVTEQDMSFSKLNFLEHTAWLMESRHNREGVQRRARWLNACVNVRATDS